LQSLQSELNRNAATEDALQSSYEQRKQDLEQLLALKQQQPSESAEHPVDDSSRTDAWLALEVRKDHVMHTQPAYTGVYMLYVQS
jgi:hypothetical protein